MDSVAQVRRFNRTVTRRIGALDDHFLGRNRSLGASRLLFEIGAAGIKVRDLRIRLGLDSGYLSRLLRGLEAEGLIRTGPMTGDGRVRRVVLTPPGRNEVDALNRLSDRAASTLLKSLGKSQRVALTSAMATVERLLLAGAVRLKQENPRSPAARRCIANYFGELAARFDNGFDPAISISASSSELTPPRGYFIVAWLDGEAIGCGALKLTTDHGEIKRMWVAAHCRGLGIGRRILLQLEELARKRRVRVLRLETNKSLTEAQSLYRNSGYSEVGAFNEEPYADHWFEKAL